MTVKFKRDHENGERPISAILYHESFRNGRFFMGTGHSVAKADWNSKKSLPKDSATNLKLRADLDRLAEIIIQKLEEYHRNGAKNIDPKEFRKTVLMELGKAPADVKTKAISVTGYITKKIEESQKETDKWDKIIKRAEKQDLAEIPKKPKGVLAQSTLNNHKQCLSFLKDYEKQGHLVAFKNIDEDFAREYGWFLEGEGKRDGLSHNTIAKHFRILKTYLGKAKKDKHEINPYYEDALKKSETGRAVLYFDNQQLNLIRSFETDDPILSRARDMLIFLSFTGLRHSDAKRVEPKHILEEYGVHAIVIKQLKTGKRVKVPLNAITTPLLEKYSYCAPYPISNQKLNDSFKDLRDAIFEKHGRENFTRKIEGKPVAIPWVTHTGRRSFASNFYKANPAAKRDIMSITGHKTEKTFNAYIGIDDQDIKEIHSSMQLAMTNMNLMTIAS